MRGFFGIVVILALAWLFSENKRGVSPRKVLMGLLLQAAIALALLRIPVIRGWVAAANRVVGALETATSQATQFLFGYLGGGPLPFAETSPGASFIVVFRVLPLVVVMSALCSVLFYWGVLPLVVRGFSFVLRRTLRISGASGLAAAADVFLGIAEAPLFVKPYLEKMTRGELFTVMTCGMASVAGTVMVLYASVLATAVPDAIGHILVASVISIPAAILMAHVFIPEPDSARFEQAEIPRTADSTMDALVRGTSDGIQMLLTIVGLILVLFALVHLINGLIAPYSLQAALGLLLRPLLWCLGIEGAELKIASELYATKVVMNEFVAYLGMGKLPPEALSPKSRLILTYAMCGFANVASLGILIGTLGSLVPERRREVLRLGWRSLLSGNLATCLTGAIVGLLY